MKTKDVAFSVFNDFLRLVGLISVLCWCETLYRRRICNKQIKMFRCDFAFPIRCPYSILYCHKGFEAR